MRVLVIGATGLVGGAAASALLAHGDEVLPASRRSELAVDVTDAASVDALFAAIGTAGALDAVVCAVGAVPFKPLADLGAEDYLSAYRGKVAAELTVVSAAVPVLADGGSITLTTGVLAREPIRTGAAAALANGALESFVVSAAAELPRGLRINAVSPTVLVEATGYHASFPGFAQVPAAEVGRAFVRAVHGVRTGQVHALDGG